MSSTELPAALVEAVRHIANLIADSEWEILARVAPASRVRWRDVAEVKLKCGKAFEHVPIGFGETLDAVPTVDGNWQIRCPLWTREEGRSDLEIQATGVEVLEGIWQLEVDDVLVP